MKKLLLLGILLLANVFYAQSPVWINSFDTPEDLAGWTFHDLNNNGNKWVQGPNIYHNGTTLAYGTSGVLRYSINNVPTGNATGFATENDWIISPEIDLTSASGTITLAAYIGRQRTTHVNVGRGLYIYESTPQKPVPALSDFQALAVDANGNQLETNYAIIGSGFTSDLSQTVEALVNISAFAGKKIYIGLWSNRVTSGAALNSQNINIDEIGIYATTILNTKDFEKDKRSTKILKNPAASELLLDLNPSFSPEEVKVTIYTMMGAQILAVPYNNRIDIAALPNGTYLINITKGSSIESLKFIKR